MLYTLVLYTHPEIKTILLITTYLFDFKDVEMWMPEVVSLAIKLCFRAKDKRAIFLPNLGKILHYQNEGNSDMIETDVYQYVKLHHEVKSFVDGCFELIGLRIYDKKCFYYKSITFLIDLRGKNICTYFSNKFSFFPIKSMYIKGFQKKLTIITKITKIQKKCQIVRF